MRPSKKLIVVSVASLALGSLGGGYALASSPTTGDAGAHEHPDRAITGSALDKASAAALRATGGGRVTESEVGDEESYYQVEVTTADGRQTDVQLDQSFQLVSSKVDRESGAAA